MTAEATRALVAGLICADSSPARWPESIRLQRLADEVHSRGGATPNAPTDVRQFSGAWHVLWGNGDIAVAEFREMARLEPANAEVLSDLAAALLERAEEKQDPLSIVEAFAAADSAVALAPKLLEARFNRAVTLEWLYLRDDAIAAWSSYLEADATSPWADEARARLRRLRTTPTSWGSGDEQRLRAALSSGDAQLVEEIATRFPSHARAALQTLILGWARAYQMSASRSDSLLATGGVLARALAKATADSQWLDIVRDVEKHTAARNERQVAATARGLIAEENARAYLNPDRMQLDSANVWITEAFRSLRSARSGAVYFAMYDSGQIPYQRHTPQGYDAALAAFGRLKRDAPPSYKYSRALAMRMEALIQALRADREAAVASYADAIHEGEGSGESGLEVRPRGTLASLLPPMRGEREAWKPLYAAFRLLPRYGDSPGEAQRLATTAAMLTGKAAPRAALLFQREAVRLAEQLGNASTTVRALATQAELLVRVGDLTTARAAARQARKYSLTITGDSIRALYTASVDLVDGVVWLRTRPDSAVVAFHAALDRYRATQNLLDVARAQVLLARAHIAAGAMDSAQRAFDDAVSELERRRAELSDSARAGFMDQARPVIDTIVQFLLRRSDTLGAIDFLEGMRARVLLERIRGAPSNGGTRGRVAALRRVIPPSTTVISYALMDRTLVAWLIRQHSVTMYRTALDEPIEPLVDRFQALLNGPSDEAELRAVSARLHQLLIGPFRQTLTPETRLVFVPDKRLQFVPFAALSDPRDGRFLIESFEIGVAPSIELYGASLARFDSLRATAPRTVLAVGNPAFDARVFRLPRLPGAEREAARVAEAYPRPRLLVDSAATVRHFFDAARNVDVIHFAGHGIVRPEAPLQSHLVLAPDPSVNSSGEIYARSLYDANFAHTRLAILSGCHTAGGELSDTEGVSSLARALFAAGVPAVIASLWALDDEHTAEFFAEFHRGVVRGVDPTTLLRQAELRWLRKGGNRWRSMSTWAAFELFGASSPNGRS